MALFGEETVALRGGRAFALAGTNAPAAERLRNNTGVAADIAGGADIAALEVLEE